MMLGLLQASEREIRAAYKQQALIHHPDKQGDKSDEEKVLALKHS
jgi:DnaJ-class molecular chaperone